LALKPLTALDKVSHELPLFVGFHLRELYLKKNLSFDREENVLAFKELNGSFLHTFVLTLMKHSVEPTVVAKYGTHLRGDKLTNFMKSVYLYCQVLKKSPEDIVSVIKENFSVDAKG
jgi:hypothetical protein